MAYCASDMGNRGRGGFRCSRAAGTLAGLLCAVLAGAESQRTGTIYNFRHSDGVRFICASIPDSTKPVRGFLFLGSHGPCPGAEMRFWARGETQHAGDKYRLLMAQFGFGIIATGAVCGSNYNPENTNLLLTALREFSALDGGRHREIQDVPLIILGGSNAGAAGYTLVNLIPQKIICATIDVPASFNPAVATEGALKVPTIVASSENDFNRSWVPERVGAIRARGGLWSWYEYYGQEHALCAVLHMNRPFWEKCIALRLPANYDPLAGPVVLNDIPQSSGWLAEDTWRTGLIDLYPYNSFPGNKSSGLWLPDQDLAYLYRGYTLWDNDPVLELEVGGRFVERSFDTYTLDIVSPGQQGTLRILPGAFAWNRIEFFRGATRIGEVTGGAPELTFTFGTESIAQTFTALVHGPAETRPAWSIGVAVFGPDAPSAARARHAPRARAVGRVDEGVVRYDLTGRLLAPLPAAGGTDRGRRGAVVEVHNHAIRSVVAACSP